uniref:Dirigent protein n=1 Tax=Hordeum vulgare subsp. vulgare TaxID=112509 RepID=A0A8I6WSG5_HORVV
MHDIIGGPGQTAVRVVKGQGPPHPSMSGSYFGDTVVMDDLLMEGPSLTSKAVGRAQGTYVLAAMGVPVLAVSVTVVITEGPYNGSTLVIACRPRRHLPGGKGDRGGRRDGTAPAGYRAQWRRTGEDVSAVYMVLELDVHATVPDGAAPAPGRRHGWGLSADS